MGSHILAHSLAERIQSLAVGFRGEASGGGLPVQGRVAGGVETVRFRAGVCGRVVE